MRISIEPIEALAPAPYNPRRVDADRLNLVEMSIRKLGFLSPIIADTKGEIISGHQRITVSKRLGLEKVPVGRVSLQTEDLKRAANLVFNRATNDMDAADTGSSLMQSVSYAALLAQGENLPDAPDPYPCTSPKRVPVKALVAANSGRWIDYAARISGTLRQYGIILPIVCTPDNRVINGIGRLQMAAEKRLLAVDVVYIEPDAAEFAVAMMNKLSMDFDVREKYADQLRYNSFRRARTTRPGLGHGFHAHHFPKFDLQRDMGKWTKAYGRTVVDFGAGHLTDTKMLRDAGIDVTPFEPFFVVGGTIDMRASLRIIDEFLEVVAAGKRFDSVFISSVLNSVPFREDREHISSICAHLLYGGPGSCYAWTMGVNHPNHLNPRKRSKNERMVNNIQFPLDYEPGILLGDLGAIPKVQKYHGQKELHETFKGAFNCAFVARVGADLSVCATIPKCDPQRLAAALEFEFDLPYPKGFRMGRVSQAKEAFDKRLRQYPEWKGFP